LVTGSEAGQEAVPLASLAATVWGDEDAVGTVRAELSRLRKALHPIAALPRAANQVAALDPDVVDSDLWQVESARKAAEQKRDHYERTSSLHEAEMAFVTSHRIMQQHAREVLSEAREKPTKELRAFVERRWQNRKEFVGALLEIGHFERAVTEHTIYLESLANRRDEFFDYDSPERALSELGRLRIDLENEPESLAERTQRRAHSRLVFSGPNGQPLKIEDAEKEIERKLANRKTADTTRARGRTMEVDLGWLDVALLLKMMLFRLQEVAFDPQVIVGVGRDGAAVGAAVSHALDCRLQGWVAVSRYQWGPRQDSHRSYFRDRELPLVRASRVLVVNDLVYNGSSTRLAIDKGLEKGQENSWYPEAEIVVASLLCDNSQPLKRESDERWITGYECALSEPSVWVNFPWERSWRSWPPATRNPEWTRGELNP
jgi:hypoxanthine phosphoribosyltransferase